MDKKDNNRNMVKKLLFILGGLLLGEVSIYVIALGIFKLMMYSVITSSSLFNIVLGVMCLPFIVGIGYFCKNAIKVETVYEFVDMNGNKIDSDLMREQLSIVKSNDNIVSNRYSYVFDNNYRDLDDDIIIDDMTYLYDNKKCMSKTRYKGKYLR